MREWFESQLASGLPALAGTTMSGTLALRDELLNELLDKFLAQARAGTPPKAPVDFGRSVDVIKAARIRAETGRVLIDFEINV